MSSNTDFIRRMPDSPHHFSKSDSIWMRLHIDPILLFLLLLLTGFGLMALYSGSGQSISMVKRQLVFFILAYATLFIVAQVKLNFMQRWALWLYALGVILLIAVLLFGVGAKGAQRWLSLGFIRFQPSEILKLAVPMTVASYLCSRVLPPALKHVLVSLAIIIVPTVLILKQPDLGTSLLIAASGVFALFMAGLRWRFIIISLVLLIASLWPIWEYVLEDYQKQRVLTLIDAESDARGAGWNTIQAKIAIGSGGVDGKGWLQGTQSQLDFLPESHTDFVIAVVAEEFGFVGVLCLILVYLCIIARGLTIAWQAQSTFNRLLASSIVLTFFVYVYVNIGMVSGILPVVGVPLPFVSLGGTSIVTLMFGFGVLMAIATEKKRVST
jgi:rod shape determining protein RodA